MSSTIVEMMVMFELMFTVTITGKVFLILGKDKQEPINCREENDVVYGLM